MREREKEVALSTADLTFINGEYCGGGENRTRTSQRDR